MEKILKNFNFDFNFFKSRVDPKSNLINSRPKMTQSWLPSLLPHGNLNLLPDGFKFDLSGFKPHLQKLLLIL